MTALATEHATMPVLGRLAPYAIRDETIAHIVEAARQIRIQDLKLVHYAGAGHIGGDFSAIDVLATLYGAVQPVTPETVDDPERDWFILSKGHVAGALYTTLAAFGFLAGGGVGHLSQAAVAVERAPQSQQGAGGRSQHRPPGSRPADRGRSCPVGQARRVPSADLRTDRRRRVAGGQQLGGHDGRFPTRTRFADRDRRPQPAAARGHYPGDE